MLRWRITKGLNGYRHIGIESFWLLFLAVSLLFPSSRAATSCKVLAFQKGQKVIVGNNPVSLVAADLNGDRQIDLAVANSGSNDVSVILAKSNGDLTSATSYPAGDGPRSIAAADFNSDSAVDLAVANSISNDVLILLGDGKGRFRKGNLCPVGLEPVSLAACDLNGDGRLDLATANTNHDLINVGLSLTATDNCPGTVVSVAVFGDENDEEATEDGNHSPDAKNIAAGTLRLRAERNGLRDGRVYLIIVTATDASGNVSRCCRTVTVALGQSKASLMSVAAQAAAARAFCEANGTAPPGYFVIGDGPIIGPIQ